MVGEMLKHRMSETRDAEPPEEATPAGSATGAPWLLRGFDRTQIHVLDAQEVDRLVGRGTSGRFALGYRDARGAFRVQYVGYAPHDLNAELKSRIGKSRYFRFRVGPLPGSLKDSPSPA